MTIKSVKPRYILATYLAMSFVFVLAASQSHGNASIGLLCMVLCWESACFATIFTLGLRGLGRHTKVSFYVLGVEPPSPGTFGVMIRSYSLNHFTLETWLSSPLHPPPSQGKLILISRVQIGGSLIVAAISGGAAFPPMTGAVATHLQKRNNKKPFHMAMLIPMMGFILAWVYPLYVNFFNREIMDSHRDTDVGLLPPPSDKELGLVDSHVGEQKGDTTTVTENV